MSQTSAKIHAERSPTRSCGTNTHMHPTLQISMLVLYVREPSRTSGARYHSVTTYDPSSSVHPLFAYSAKPTSLLNVFTGTPNALANPKSPIFSSPLRLMSRFCGLRSRCSTRLSWQNAMPWIQARSSAEVALSCMKELGSPSRADV